MMRVIYLMLLGGVMLLAGIGGPAGGARAVDDFQDARQAMVARQLQRRDITDPRVLIAMGTVPRHRFVPTALASQAYGDHPLPIGSGQTISQPYIVALMSQWAEVAPGDKVLEVGTGSGYQAAVLAELAHQVFSIEILPDLARRPRRASRSWATSGCGSGAATATGAGRRKPLLTPFWSPRPRRGCPRPWRRRLKEGGRLVIPLGTPYGAQNLRRYRQVQGKLVQEASVAVRFVPLVRPPMLEAAPGDNPPAAVEPSPIPGPQKP